ncbi:MAG: CoA transferase [Acidimicrobiales bacterium]|nr:CoA transferase [Acidimicrobiales bacterium]
MPRDDIAAFAAFAACAAGDGDGWRWAVGKFDGKWPSSPAGRVVSPVPRRSAMLAGIEVGVPYWADDLVPCERQGNRRAAISPRGLYPCADGWAPIVVVVPEHWDALGAWIHERTGKEAAIEPVYRDVLPRVEAAELMTSGRATSPSPTRSTSCSPRRSAAGPRARR